MIVLEDDTKKVQAEWSQAGPSLPITTPAFDSHHTDHLLVDFAEPPQESYADPPPDFEPYDAENFEVGYKDVVSHDAHLNSDGEALYRFLLSQSESAPSHRMHCRGTHTEHRHRWVTARDANGRSHSRQETYTETVTDFDFCIDIVPREPVRPVHWSVADDEPAYRGKMVREYEGVDATGWGKRRRATRGDVKAYKAWVEERGGRGYPPWVRQIDVLPGEDGSTVGAERTTLRSSKTLRQWADDYCASPKCLKEFVYHKVLYGWDIQQIESAVRATISAAPYNGSFEVSFTPYNSKIYVRPNNKVSRMLSNKWLKVLSIVLLIFPFIWLFKRFHSRGGGRWEVCGGAYPMKQWVPLEAGDEGEMTAAGGEQLPAYNPFAVSSPGGSSALTTASYGSRRSTRYRQTPSGPRKLIGLREGEWFRSWEGVIHRAVVGCYQSSEPLPSAYHSSLPARTLDGYDESTQLVQY